MSRLGLILNEIINYNNLRSDVLNLNDLNKINDDLKQKDNQHCLITKINERTIKSIESWTTHGLPNIIRSKNIVLKIIWSILFLIGVGLTIYCLIKTVTEYLEYSVTTEVRSINVNEIEFPTITICNSNQVSTEYGLNYYKSVFKKIDFDIDDQFKQDPTTNWYLMSIDNIVPAKYFYEIPIIERRNLTLPIEIMFDSAYLDDTLFTAEDFQWIFNPIYGNCYIFNPNGNVKFVKSYKQNEMLYRQNQLNMVFVLKHPEMIDKYGFDKSLFVSFNEVKSNPFIGFKNLIELPVGSMHKIRLEKSVFNKYPKPYSNCDFVVDDDVNFPAGFDAKYYNQIKSAGYHYSQSLCISFCKIDLIGKDCTLRISSLNAPNNVNNFCPNKNLTVRDELPFSEFFENKQIDEKCEKMCPLECNTIEYQVVSTPGFIKTINLQENYSDYIRLSIYYNSFSYLNYKESPTISIYNLISNIGGVLGLLLGIFNLVFSIFTFLFINYF